MAADGHTILPEPPPAMPDNLNPFRTDAGAQHDDGGDYCRICRGEATNEQPLFYPCKCSGSIRYVHQDCLMEWLAHSKKKYCELCKTPFHFTKLYDKSMPATLPLPLFLQQMLLYGYRTLMQWSRYSLVILVWLMCLPWCIRQVWRGLFWLADGSWLSDSQYRNATLRQLNATLAELERINSTLTATGLDTLNRTFVEGILTSTLPNDQEKPVSLKSISLSLLRRLNSHSLITEMLRMLFSLPPVQVSPSTNSSIVKGLGARQPNQRPPSLLSGMRFMKKITNSTAINNLSIDVIEGLVICLGLVAGFILVFLIREWVINQQPLLNIPDPDLADNQAAAAPPIDAEGRPIIRPRRRRILPRGVDQVGLPPLPVDQAMLQQAPGMPPRRAFTDDNIAIPVVHERERPELPVRAASLVPENFSFRLDDAPDQILADEHQPPPPLLRGALGEVVNVHRTIEERMPEATVTDHKNHAVATLEPETMTNKPVEAPEPKAPIIASVLPEDQFVDLDIQDAFDRWMSATKPYDEPTEEPSEEPSQYSNSSHLPATEPTEEPLQYSDSDSPAIATPESEGDGIPTDISEAGDSSHGVVSDEDQINGNETPSNVEPEPKRLRDKLIDWLWRVDGPMPQPALENGQDDTHVVEDLHAEAPFVPIQNGVIVPAGAQPPQAVDVQPPQDHAPIQIEWNDQNAADDAEDLEGVLELIGMEGPLVGMVQNVIFSLFLITLTLTASIWIPYVWGKLALIFIAHPIAVAVKGPAMLISTAVDVIADLGMFVLGITGLLFNHLTVMVKTMMRPIFPSFSNLLDTKLFGELALNATKSSGTRLEHTITGAATAVSLSSDLPTFSMESHRSLQLFKATMANGYAAVATATREICASVLKFDRSFQEQRKWVSFAVNGVNCIARSAVRAVQTLRKENLKSLLKPSMNTGRTITSSSEYLLTEWSTQDKIIAIALGYAFFAFAGFIFMKGSRLFLGLRKGEKVPGALADSLRQAGGVLKVVVIIGIEMLVFPLYCGLLLDLALLPLFEGATVWTRLAFIRRAPFTGLFLHWFVGTCYMFHFALFVSMCRKILRRGVLYFIRDPDDPTFHPVRDVLERPVPTQLCKIAFSALVYGGLVIMCLGGVVWSVGRIDGLLPIRWSTPEPRLAFPVDVVFYNFMLPIIMRKSEPSKRLAAIYEWWFRGCAHGLRLSHFLFGEEREEEKLSDALRLPWSKSPVTEKDGSYVRAPGSDSCRIPKGQKVFLEVSEDNQRLDGKPDQDKGLQGKSDDKWTKIYLPPKFKARLATFIALLWIFAAGTGVTLTITPLLVGRALVMWASGSPGPVNDLYALTLGLHILGFGILIANHQRDARQWTREKIQKYLPDPKGALPHIWATMKYCAGLLYVLIAFGAIFPFALSLITELYINIPIFTFLAQPSASTDPVDISTPTATASWPRSSPTVFILQTWTLGLLYTRLALRIALNYPSADSRIATAIRAVVRDGYMHPDIKQASRAIILPFTALCIILLAAPLGYAKLLITVMRIKDTEHQMRLYRYAYPGLWGMVVAGYGSVLLGRRIEEWRTKIRDEVYLVGERLHNYVEKREKSNNGKGKEKEDAGVSAARFPID